MFMTALPRSIDEYRINASSPSGDLLTLGHFYAEVGGYCSSVMQPSFLKIADKCRHRFGRIVNRLIDRGVISDESDMYVAPECGYDISRIKDMSVEELGRQFRLCYHLSSSFQYEGREHFTYYRQRRIVDELLSRRASSRSERIVIDSCNVIYANEIENLSFVLRKPVGDIRRGDVLDASETYTEQQIIALLRAYSGYKDVMEREALVECVDLALDMIESSPQPHLLIDLISEVAQLKCRRLLTVPDKMIPMLENAVIKCYRCKDVSRTRLILPMLIVAHEIEDYSWYRKVSRIINPCYRNIIDSNVDISDIDEIIQQINVVVKCCEFVRRFNFRKSAPSITSLIHRILSSRYCMTATQIHHLLEAGKEYEEISPEMTELTAKLQNRLDELASQGDIEAKAYMLYEL